MFNFLKKMKLPFVLVTILILPLFFGVHVPYSVKSFFYAVSLSMKEVLIRLLPFIIFSFLFYSLLNLKSGVFKFIVLLVGMVYVSNLCAIFTGFAVGNIAISKLSIPMHQPSEAITLLVPAWYFQLPKLIGNEIALIAGFFCGLFFSVKRNQTAERCASLLSKWSNFFLKKIFTPLLPLFILGFVFKLEQDELLEKALRIYGPVFLVVVGTQIAYMIFLYLAVSGFSLKKFFFYLKNVLPATITGFSAVSSAASMPVLIVCSEKNLHNPVLAEIVVPATINIHTLGSALGIIILSLTTMHTFGYPLPSLPEFLHFGLFYGLAKFSVAAVPGGGILVAAPLLEHFFHFSSEMIGLLIAIYVLFDPFGTATNVTGNGLFAILFSKAYNYKTQAREQKA